jgi:RimJ/RimL family protein N-acetyltransferase
VADGAPAAGDWSVRLETNDRLTRALLERDRDWSAYLLADLEAPFRQHSRYHLAAQAGVDRATLLVYAPPEFTALASMGEVAGVAAALAAVDLPASASLGLPLDHRAVFETFFTVETWARMRRMVLAPEVLILPPGLERAERLDPSDQPALARLYEAREHVGYFTADMLTSGVYYGVRQAGRLVAAAGTHVVAPQSRLAAIGNVFTEPAARGRGYGSATTAAVARALLDQDCTRVVLNVSASNAAAIRVYERLGFTTAMEYWETDLAERRAMAG